MKRPEDLHRKALIEIVKSLQTTLFLDRDERGPVWNLDKDWSGFDILSGPLRVMCLHELAPWGRRQRA
jgi:hypothetical protein